MCVSKRKREREREREMRDVRIHTVIAHVVP